MGLYPSCPEGVPYHYWVPIYSMYACIYVYVYIYIYMVPPPGTYLLGVVYLYYRATLGLVPGWGGAPQAPSLPDKLCMYTTSPIPAR